MEAYHNRMPAGLEEKDFDAWLDGSAGPGSVEIGARRFLARSSEVDPGFRTMV